MQHYTRHREKQRWGPYIGVNLPKARSRYEAPMLRVNSDKAQNVGPGQNFDSLG